MYEENAEYQVNMPFPDNIHVEDGLLFLTNQNFELVRYPEEQSDVADDDWS